MGDLSREAVYVCGAPASGKSHFVEILRDRAAAHTLSHVGLRQMIFWPQSVRPE